MAYYGVYLGVVSATNDPQQSGRVQIRLPWLGSTVWALVATPVGSPPTGRIPPGATVVVAFERGDQAHPVVLGCVQGVP
jgi:uncharacterized protein involved in type VI secretion and phage assembly